MMPSPPALETAAANSAKPTKCMPPWMMGCSMPNNSVIAVFTALPPPNSVWCCDQSSRTFGPRSLLVPERADLHLEGPGALRLLVELPVGVRDRGRRHLQVG